MNMTEFILQHIKNGCLIADVKFLQFKQNQFCRDMPVPSSSKSAVSWTTLAGGEQAWTDISLQNQSC